MIAETVNSQNDHSKGCLAKRACCDSSTSVFDTYNILIIDKQVTDLLDIGFQLILKHGVHVVSTLCMINMSPLGLLEVASNDFMSIGLIEAFYK